MAALLLPTNLAPVANFADKRESGARWAVTGVHIEAKDDGYTVVATDCKALIVVEGKYPEGHDPNEYPLHGALKDARNGGTKALIPAKLFQDVMKDAAKNTKRTTKPILKNVAVIMADAVPEKLKKRTVTDGENPLVIEGGNTVVETPGLPGEVVLGWTNLEQEATPKTRTVEGRFPPYQDIIPKRGLYNIAFDMDLLINAGKALEGLKGLTDPENKRVEISFTSGKKPLLMRMRHEELQQTTTILLMPLLSEGESYDGFSHSDICDETYWQKEAKSWKNEYESLLVRFNKDEEEIRKLEKQLKAAKVENFADKLKEAEATIERQSNEYRSLYEQSQQMEKRLLQLSAELSACEGDKEMYRQRAETVAAG